MADVGGLATVSSLPAAPVADTTERLHVLDILRGLALCGMILVHFHQAMRVPASGAEGLIGWFVWVGLEQKAWGTFALLFGVGFAVLLRRLEARGVSVVPFYLRRLAVLAVLGVITDVFFGMDALLQYAMWGVPLLFIRKWSTRGLLIAAAVAAATRPLAAAAIGVYTWNLGPEAVAVARTGPPPGWTAVQAAEQQGSYVELLWARLALLGWRFTLWRTYLPGVNLTLFILGLLALRHDVFDATRRHVRLIAGWMIFGAASWAVVWLLLDRIPRLPIAGLTYAELRIRPVAGTVALLHMYRGGCPAGDVSADMDYQARGRRIGGTDGADELHAPGSSS